jgi:mevalonate kinase
LIKGTLEQHIQTLVEKGAVAVKPTGAGSGGYVVSLWDRPPPEGIPFDLDPCLEPI